MKRVCLATATRWNSSRGSSWSVIAGARRRRSANSSPAPDHAQDIRELFPALVVMEQVGPALGHGRPLDASMAALERLGEYRIIREVGHGGMGVVYEAEQEALGRPVALKVLPRAAARDGQCLLRFRREARAAARLHHTNIVPVFDIGERDGLHFYAMQLIYGQPLDAVITELRRLRGSRPATVKHAVPSSAASLADGLLADDFQREARRAATAFSQQHRRPPKDRTFASSERRGRSRQERRFVRILEFFRLLDPLGFPLLQKRGAHRRASRQCPGSRARPADIASRHQAVEPASRRPGHRMGDGLWPRQGPRGRPYAHRRRRGHAPIHGARAVLRPDRRPQRHL